MTRFKYWLGSVWNSFRESTYQSIIGLFGDIQFPGSDDDVARRKSLQ